jgi:hypothetical protein
LALQVGALVVLAQLDPAWSIAASVAFVMAVQGVSGVAKDLAKMSSKSAVKLLAPKEDGGLFCWVSALTGSKNAVKGLGFFLGAALLALAGFKAAVLGMAAVLAVILIAVVLFLPAGLPGRMKANMAWGGWRSKDARVNRLSLARMFLFGARDVWFVVGVPVYFQMILADGTPEGRRAAFFLIGSFLALWIIAYGAVQAAAPRILGGKGQTEAAITHKAILWAGLLVPIPFALALAAWAAGGPADWLTATLMAGLLLFGFVFAVNSSVHSYLILAFRTDHPRCGVLLYGQRRRPPDRHLAVGPQLPVWRLAAVPGDGRRHGTRKLDCRAKTQLRLTKNSASVAANPTSAVNQMACSPRRQRRTKNQRCCRLQRALQKH